VSRLRDLESRLRRTEEALTLAKLRAQAAEAREAARAVAVAPPAPPAQRSAPEEAPRACAPKAPPPPIVERAPHTLAFRNSLFSVVARRAMTDVETVRRHLQGLVSYHAGTLTPSEWIAIRDSWRKTVPRLRPPTEFDHGALATLLADELGLDANHVYAMISPQYAWLELPDDQAKAVCDALTRVGCDAYVRRWQYIRSPERWGTS